MWWFAILGAALLVIAFEFQRRRRGRRIDTGASAMSGQSLRWSENPSARERHLQRRDRNPLFPPMRRVVLQSEIDLARSEDDRDIAHLREQAVAEMSSFGVAARSGDGMRFMDVASHRMAFQSLILQCRRIGGAGGQEVEALLRPLLVAVEKDLDAATLAAETVPESLEEQDLMLRADFERLAEQGIVLQISEPNSVIAGDDLGPAILSEPVQVLQQYLVMIDESQQAMIRQGFGIILVDGVRALSTDPSLKPILDLDQKVAALMGTA